ncbi:MAG: MBL fold metallo-hydrolase, partial [Gemmatimonadota bacterium]|nr:MBL fold metallo-hydrolase [Gemmatimonadota bacterium]
TVDLSAGGRERRLVFSGDIGRKGLPILRDPVMPPGADVVIMESTYGDRVHEPASKAKHRLRACADRVCREGGYLIIPAFSLGRTQEVVYSLNQLWEAGELPRVPVWVDSPLAVRVTDVFNEHRECWDAEMLETLHSDHDRDPLGFETLTYVRDVEQSKALNHRKGPGVIISASGMCEAGRILHHLRNHATHPGSTVLFVGYQAEHTLGRKILDGRNPVRIYGQDVEILAAVERADSYSAHAGRDELLAWSDGVREAGHVDRWFLVHGERESQESLAGALGERGAADVVAPERLQKFEL